MAFCDTTSNKHMYKRFYLYHKGFIYHPALMLSWIYLLISKPIVALKIVASMYRLVFVIHNHNN